jgi:nuclear transport factor 2 (NTF2) superfamily protein
MCQRGETAVGISFNAALEKAARYAAAWSSNDPEQVAAHYSEGGSATLNGGDPIVGRTEIARDYAAPFFRDFPGSTVLMHDFRLAGAHGLFTGMLVGTRPESGNPVRLLGWEEWTLDEHGLIMASLVWFDQADYTRQAQSTAL